MVLYFFNKQLLSENTAILRVFDTNLLIKHGFVIKHGIVSSDLPETSYKHGKSRKTVIFMTKRRYKPTVKTVILVKFRGPNSREVTVLTNSGYFRTKQ